MELENKSAILALAITNVMRKQKPIKFFYLK